MIIIQKEDVCSIVNTQLLDFIKFKAIHFSKQPSIEKTISSFRSI